MSSWIKAWPGRWQYGSGESRRREEEKVRVVDVRHYESVSQDSSRWAKLSLRPDDIIVVSPVKSGMTWVQTICGLLIFQSPDFPERLRDISPWIDAKASPVDDVTAILESQEHRRFIKTHTPVDGLPVVPGVKLIFVARHPLDAAVSFYHQLKNINYPELMSRLGLPTSIDVTPQLDEREWLVEWIDEQADPIAQTESLAGMLRHVRLAWDRRDDPDVILVHYEDLLNNLDDEMRRIAARLDLGVPDRLWPGLVSAASFRQMAGRAELLTPSEPLTDRRAFFRHGRSGDGLRLLNADQVDRYHSRAGAVLGPELSAWLHRHDGS